MTTVTEHLTAAYDAFCKRHGLPERSADEVLFEIAHNDVRAPFLRAFIAVWDIAQAEDDAHARQQEINRAGPHYRTEFPSFEDHASIGRLILAGWKDNSWHNDTCPCLVHPGGDLQLWVEWEAPDQRESGGARYCVQKVDHAGEGWAEGDDICATDDLDEAMRAAEAWVAAQRAA